jgi:hypothetical protein
LGTNCYTRKKQEKELSIMRMPCDHSWGPPANSLAVAMSNYIKPITAAGEAGFKLIEQAIQKEETR